MLKTSDTTVCNLKVWNTWHFFVLQFCPLFPEVLLVRTASSSGKGVVSDTGYSRPSKEENGDEVKFRQKLMMIIYTTASPHNRLSSILTYMYTIYRAK